MVRPFLKAHLTHIKPPHLRTHPSHRYSGKQLSSWSELQQEIEPLAVFKAMHQTNHSRVSQLLQ